MRRALAAAVAALLGAAAAFVVLPGDADVPAGEDAPLAPASADEVGPGDAGARPTWRVGEAWRMEFPGGACEVVVARAGPEGYALAPTCLLFSMQDAAGDLPFVGRMGPDLEGQTQDGATRWFDWPLVDGKSWTTRFGGRDVRVVARAAEVAGLDGPEPGFVLAMSAQDVTVLTYDYVPSLGWWSGFSYPSGFEMRIGSHVFGWKGPAYLADADKLLSQQSFATVDAFTVEAKHDYLYATRQLVGTGYEQPVLVRPDGALETMGPMFALFGGAGFQQWQAPAMAGSWTFVPSGATLGSRAIDIWGVHVEAFTVG